MDVHHCQLTKKMNGNVDEVDVTDLRMTTTERGRRRRTYTSKAKRVKRELDDARKQKTYLSAVVLNDWEQELQQLVEEALEANEVCKKNDPDRADDFEEWAEMLKDQYNELMAEIEGAREEEHMVFTSPVGGSQDRTFTDDITKRVSEKMSAVLVEHQKGASEPMSVLLAQHKKGISEKMSACLKKQRVERKRD